MYAVRSGCRRNATRERRAAAFGRADDYYSKMPKMGGRLRRHGYHWSMRPMEEAQMVGEENPVLPSAEEHHPGTQGTS